MAKALTTPKGTARFAALEIPDEFTPEQGEKQIKYKTDLILDGNAESTKKLIERLEELRDEHYDSLPKRKRDKLDKAAVYENEYDENDEATGNVIFKFKCNAQFTDAQGNVHKLRPERVDAHKRALPLTTRIFGGSTIKVAFKPIPYDGFGKVGVSLRLMAVQVIELRQNSAASMFDDEDGFAAEDEDTEDSADAGESEDDSDDDMF